MKIAIINDTHFGVRGDADVLLRQQQKFYEKTFFPTIDAEGVSAIVHLGDTFDKRKQINFNTLYQSKLFYFDEIEKRGIDYHMVIGNHDTYYKNTNEINSPNLLLQEYSTFKFHENDIANLAFGNTNMTLVPWMNSENTEQILSDIQKSNTHVLAGHFQIKGFEMNRGSVATHGLDKQVFSNFEMVLSGHFHHPSEYGNIKYLGAPYEMNWNDHAGKRGFHILDCDTRELTHVQNPYFVFCVIDYDDTDMNIDEVNEMDTSMFADTFIRLVVKKRTNTLIQDLFIEKLEKSGAADVKVVEDELDLYVSGSEEGLEGRKDTKDIIHDYIENVDTKIDKNKIRSEIEGLYLEALNIG